MGAAMDVAAKVKDNGTDVVIIDNIGDTKVVKAMDINTVEPLVISNYDLQSLTGDVVFIYENEALCVFNYASAKFHSTEGPHFVRKIYLYNCSIKQLFNSALIRSV